MRKLLLVLTFASATIFLNAQSVGCVPDNQYTAAGIYPDTATGLAPGYVGASYTENITIITPTDTTVDVLGTMVSVTIDSIVLTSVTNLPPNFSYACNPPSCGFAGGTIKCAELYSIQDPSPASVGNYDIIFETTSYASNVPFLGTMTQDDVIDYYYIEIFPEMTTSTINKFDNTTFELKGSYPNPVVNQAKIQFISGTTESIVF